MTSQTGFAEFKNTQKSRNLRMGLSAFCCIKWNSLVDHWINRDTLTNVLLPVFHFFKFLIVVYDGKEFEEIKEKYLPWFNVLFKLIYSAESCKIFEPNPPGAYSGEPTS